MSAWWPTCMLLRVRQGIKLAYIHQPGLRMMERPGREYIDELVIASGGQCIDSPCMVIVRPEVEPSDRIAEML
jgi:hypothetical protein